MSEESVLNKALKTIGKGIGIGVVVGIALLVQHSWSKAELDSHSQINRQAIEDNRQSTARSLEDLQSKFDALQQDSDTRRVALDDCVRANRSLRHDMEELKRIMGITINSDLKPSSSRGSDAETVHSRSGH